MISRFFIDRPIFASVLSIILVIAGLASMRILPVSQYPDIVPPDVVVNATYPGASAQVIAETVAAPLEQVINGVPNMLYMRSTNTNSGQMNLTVTFEIGTDPDQATIDVNNRVQAALAKLPEEVRRFGITVNKKSSTILEVVTMFSPDKSRDTVFVSNYALLNVLDELKRVEGIGDAVLFGARDYSMRVWLRPDKLAQYNLTPGDVAAAIREQNSQFAAGQFGQEPMNNKQAFTYSVSTQGRLVKPEEFEQIILRSDAQGATLLLKDVARIELGAQDYSFAATFNGKPAIAMGMYLQPGANALAVTKRVAATMAKLKTHFPAGVDYAIPFNTARFVDVSIQEVIHTFIEAIILVTLVVFLFLQNVRATLIPLLAIPVSLIGTFAGMYLLGFSINLLTLFGMVLSIGVVVDDAIVVLENVERLMRTERLSPRDAAIKAMEEVTGPVVAIVLVLCAVFIPVGFLGGLTGEMYKQFAITIAVSVIISGMVALTLTPAMCALILKPHHDEPSGFFHRFNMWFARMTDRYAKGASFIMKRTGLGLVVFAVVIVLAVGVHSRIPATLVPEEDQGYVLNMPILLPAASLARTQAVTSELTKRLMAQPEVKDVVTFSGFDLLTLTPKSSAGVAFVPLKDWDLRKKEGSDAKSLTGRFMGMAADIKEAIVVSFNPPPITGISLTGGVEGYLQSRAGDSISQIAANAGKLVAAAQKRPEFASVQSTLSANVPQYYLNVDRPKAKALDVPLDAIFTTMQSTFGSFYVNDFTLYGRIFRVSMQAEAEFREKPEDLRHVFVRSTDGNMIPLSTLVTMKRIIGPDLVERFNAFPAGKIIVTPAPGRSSSEAITIMEDITQEILGGEYSIGWIGSAYQEKATEGSGSTLFIFGMIMVFLILAAQYERWSLPLAVITAVPFAILGAVLAVWMRGLYNDVYFQVGLLVLIGLGAKNAILIVEFAVMRKEAGQTIMDAALEAAKLRFRPIIMTSLAFILGCLPLAISTGAGAASRHSIGTGVIGGMLAATFVATFFIPMFYVLIESYFGRKKS